jgi:hypothetical protein
MDKLEQLSTASSEIHELVEQFMPWALALTKASPTSRSVQLFIWFIVKTDFLKNGILDLCESENLYAANVVFRSLIFSTVPLRLVPIPQRAHRFSGKSHAVGVNGTRQWS